MLNQQTIEKLHQLKLIGFCKTFENHLAQPESYNLSFEERIALCVDSEVIHRDNRKRTRLLLQAKLRYPEACVENINYRHTRDLDRSKILSLATGDWVKQQHNLLITGPTGCGKTWLACALANQICRQGLPARYLRVSSFLSDLRIAQGDGSYPKVMDQLMKMELIILDDFGIQCFTPEESNLMLELLEDRQSRKSTIITAQLPLEHWHAYLGNAAIADAILDRILSNAHTLKLKGESMRSRLQTESSKVNAIKQKNDTESKD